RFSRSATGRGRAWTGDDRRDEVVAVAVVDRGAGVDPDLREVGLVDLDLRHDAALAEQLVADLRLRVVEALRHRLAAAGLLEHVERAVAGVDRGRHVA